MNIFEFRDFRQFLADYIQSRPKKGRGLLAEWSKAVGLHTTMMSQILSGKRELSFEHAELLCDILSISSREKDYFLLLVSYSKSGSARLKKYYLEKIKLEQEKSKIVKERLELTEEIREEARSIYYSNWTYSAIRNLTAVDGFQNPTQIANKLNLPIDFVSEVLNFLVKFGFCQLSGGKYCVGETTTFIPASSPHVTRHHQNWRQVASQKMLLRRHQDFFLTIPMSLSAEDSEKIREMLLEMTKKISTILRPSKSEVVRCLNIDFFEY